MEIKQPNGTTRILCVACYDREQEAERFQVQLGEYLRKTIGAHGIESFGFSNFNVNHGNAEAFHRSKNFDPGKENLFLWGPCGTGKTHLAGAIFKAACGKGLRVRWTKPHWIERDLRGAFRGEEIEIMDTLTNVDVLIIDDVGIGRELNTVLRMLYELTDRRTSAKKNGLVITSNESLEALAKAYKDDRIVSRIAGMCSVIAVNGDDYRLNKHERKD